MRTHLFVAPGSAAFGEVLLGLRLAREVAAAGDRVMFLAPAAHALLFEGTPFAHGHIDKIATVLDRALPDVIRDRRADTVVLLDLLVTLLALGQRKIDPRFLDELPVPTYALDIWDLRRSDLRFDMVDAVLALPEAARTIVPRRLVPVPFARLDSQGAYCALPDLAPRTAAPADRRVLVTTARFQTRGLTPAQAELVREVPARLVDACRATGAEVIHVGARPVATGARYQFRGQLPPAEFERLVAAADVLVTPNQAATGISTALALGVPAIAVVGERFRVLPLGLRDFMSPILLDNPYLDAVPAVTVDERADRLFDPDLRARARANMRTYIERVRTLPTGGSLLTPEA